MAGDKTGRISGDQSLGLTHSQEHLNVKQCYKSDFFFHRILKSVSVYNVWD